jgi:hypothetical protein
MTNLCKWMTNFFMKNEEPVHVDDEFFHVK